MRLPSRPTLILLFVMSLGLTLFTFAGPKPTSRRTTGIEGHVLDADGPVARARVRFQGTSSTARTDARGRFHFRDEPAGRTVTAWKEGYFIGGTRLALGRGLQTRPQRGVIRLSRLPAEDNADYQWVDPKPNSAEVHNCGNCHAEIFREWSHSGHSHSATGRHFRNLYEGTDWNGRAGVGWGLLTQYPDGSGVCASCHAPTATEYDLRRVEGVAARGVHCDYCHKIAEVADGPIGLSHGRFNLRLLRPSVGQLFFGALDDVDRGEDVFSPLYRDSRYCASCHEGIVFGVHVYSTYSEWQASPAAREGKQCQDCHMKPTGRMTNMAPGHGGIPRDPHTLANHRFFDGSQEDMLRRAVKASATWERGPGGVTVRVRLWADGVGHRLPTGFVDRHLLLVVEGSDPDGKPLPVQSGPRLPALTGPELEGKPGRLFARVLRDFDGHSPVPFWLAAPDPPSDTRLVPGKIDETIFEFPPTLTRLRLRVLYGRFWPEVVRVKKWPDRDWLVLDREYTLTP